MIGYESNMLIYLTFLNNTIDNIATLNLKNQFTALKGGEFKHDVPHSKYLVHPIEYDLCSNL